MVLVISAVDVSRDVYDIDFSSLPERRQNMFPRNKVRNYLAESTLYHRPLAEGVQRVQLKPVKNGRENSVIRFSQEIESFTRMRSMVIGQHLLTRGAAHLNVDADFVCARVAVFDVDQYLFPGFFVNVFGLIDARSIAIADSLHFTYRPVHDVHCTEGPFSHSYFVGLPTVVEPGELHNSVAGFASADEAIYVHGDMKKVSKFELNDGTRLEALLRTTDTDPLPEQ